MRRVCPGKPGAGNPHAGFYLGGETQGRPRSLSTNHAIVHEWLVTFFEYRIVDRRIVRLIQKWLKAGVLEDGKPMHSETGGPQGQVFPRSRPTSPCMTCLTCGHTSGVSATAKAICA